MSDKTERFLKMMHDFIEKNDMTPSEFLGSTCYAICDVSIRLGYSKNIVIEKISNIYDHVIGE